MNATGSGPHNASRDAPDRESHRTLPIDDALPPLHAALRDRSVAVLEAPPGAGKTTRVPLSLLNAPWLRGARIVMLEPRRLAARAAAQYMSRTLGESVGNTVGYRVRGDSRTSSRTRIEVVTEGVLTRLLASDPTLDGVGIVIFDEFHERSLNADLGLALTLHTQSLLRHELRVLVMSATLDGDAVAALLADAQGDAPVILSRGRMFPVSTHYRPPRPADSAEAHASRVVREVLDAHDGDVLVFLPGAREIRRTASLLESHVADRRDPRVSVHELFGIMPLAAQDAAIAAAPPGTRKIVLATSIAETSLTIEGVRVVVDTGRSRLPRYDVRVGLSRLTTVRVSRAAADQRRGRAGRVAPGDCYRLWDAHEDAMLPPRTRPEILDADLTPFALELADAGIHDASSLRWLDAPSSAALAQARELLTMLGALDANARITPHGRDMVALPVHPRLAHMMLHAKSRDAAVLGAIVAACLEERDVLRGSGGPAPADLRLRVELVQGASAESLGSDLHGAVVDRDGVRRVREVARDLAARLGVTWREQRDDVQLSGELIALAFPDRVAQQRAALPAGAASGSSRQRAVAPTAQRARYVLRSGSGASLDARDALLNAPWLAVAELDGSPPDYRVLRACPIDEAAVRRLFAGQILEQRHIEWDDAAARLTARRQTRLGELLLDDAPLSDASAEERVRVLLDVVRRRGLSMLPFPRSVMRLRERMAFVQAHDASWPNVSDQALIDDLEQWLAPLLHAVRRFEDIREDALGDALLQRLSWTQRAALDRLAPTHVEVPSGSRIAIDYSESWPVLAVKLQEVFGWSTTPMLLDGRVPLTLHLLSPAQRPVQVTRDLAGFWRDGYFDVRKELRGRYPRHPWPDDPLSAPATRRAKPR